MQGSWVPSLVRELRSCMLCGGGKKINKQKFKNGFLIFNCIHLCDLLINEHQHCLYSFPLINYAVVNMLI